MLFGPHETNLGNTAREITDAHVAYYAARAAGGAGVIVTEAASVHHSDHPYAYAPAAFSGATLRRPVEEHGSPAGPPVGAAGGAAVGVPAAAGWAAVVAACRPHGSLVLAGLAHAGGQGSTAHSGHPLWGPSAVPDVVSREVPVEMSGEEIDAVVRGFAAAARSAVDSGVDGVEISAGQHSLLRQFCSGLTNHRSDDHGRDRTLLLREVLAAVREAIGPAPILGLRLCVDELAPWAGITPGDGLALARTVAPTVDLLVPVVGSGLSVGATRPDLHVPEAFLRERCAAVRRASTGATAVVLAGSVASPHLADEVLSSGGADVVDMTRAQIADPDLVVLARAGTPERIRPCLLTHALAAARDPRNPIVGDEMEPRSGHERTEPAIRTARSAERTARVGARSAAPGPAVAARPVRVVGGGPAGLEAARTLALLGHPVTVHERRSRLGGMLHAAATLPGRARLVLPVAWWTAELERLGVRVELGSNVDESLLAAARQRGELVVLATGSCPGPREFDADVPVLTAAELLDAVSARTPQRVLDAAGVARDAPVLVRDPLGDWTGPGTAELLAAAGYVVTLSTPDAVAGHQLGRCGDMAAANARLERAGVTRALFTELCVVGDGVAELVDVHTGAVTRTPCAAVVDCGPRVPDLTVTDGPGRRPAGDRVAPRTLAEAVREGRRVAQAVAGETAGPDRTAGAAQTDPRPAPDDAPTRRPAEVSPDVGPGVRNVLIDARAPERAARSGPGTGGNVRMDPMPWTATAARAPDADGAVAARSRLAAPLRLGRLELRNRIVFTAHLTGYAEGGMPTGRHIAYYAARAAGGAGLVITEEHAVHPEDRPYERMIRGHDPAVLPAYRRLTDAVHEHGAAVLAQLNHNGAQGSGMYSREPVVGPTASADPMFREVASELDGSGIAEIVAAFADTAARCVAGGFDGVELQCSHASLLRLFLSPATNRRTDSWGRDRAKLVLDVVAAVRAAIGPEPVLGLRIGADERIPGGITPDDGADLARRLAATGQVDHLNTSVGVATSTLHLIEPSMHTPPGYAGHLAATLRRAVRATGSDIPVIGVGRFTTPEQAAAALRRDECDLVGVARGQIADPEFAAKALAGRPVRRCVGCNQDCIGRVGLNLRLGCAVNPGAGRDRSVTVSTDRPAASTSAVDRPVGPTTPGLRVLVAGAGPAGLSAAGSLARRGHDVLLAERAATPGGRLALAATAPGRGELAHVVADLLREAGEAGVTIRYGVTVDERWTAGYGPDAVVLATGARPRLPHWDPDRLSVPVDDVLAGAKLPAGPVLVIDELGFHPATSTAELLAARGHPVEIVTPALVVGQDLGLTLDREGFRRRAHAAGIRCTTDLAVLGVVRTGEQSKAVELLHHPTGRIERREVAAVVAAVAPTVSVPRIGDGPWTVQRIGDALTPRRMDAAIREGAQVPVGTGPAERLASCCSRM